MDEHRQKQDSNLDEQKAFSETLVPDDSGPIELPKDDEEPQAPAAAKTTPGKQPPWVGKIMGRFKLLRLIGEGAMGLVIQAEDTSLKRIVALKVLRKQLSAGEKGKAAVEQFLREARAAAAIEHPNIVRVYEINQHAGWWYIAMEMVEGNSLQDIVKAAGALPPSRACPIIADAATALHVAHEIGMVHRDIKPSNILVTRNGHGKISDFGLVRIDDPSDPFDMYAHKSIGTPLYMAPEIIRREAAGPPVDIYSLGAALYFTLTGRPPYMADEMKDILHQHVHSAPPDLQQYLPDGSPTLAALIKRMMAKQPDIRPTASEVAAILNAESIAFFVESPSGTGSDGSTVGMDWQTLHQRTRTSVMDRTHRTGTSLIPRQAKPVMQSRWIAAVAAVLVLAGLAAVFFITRTPKQDRRALEKLFPQAPQSYGTRESGVLPVFSAPIEPPAFSWKGKVDTTNIRFVAARSGRYYYPIDDKRALYIRADQFVGYQTPEQAAQAHKLPAP